MDFAVMFRSKVDAFNYRLDGVGVKAVERRGYFYRGALFGEQFEEVFFRFLGAFKV